MFMSNGKSFLDNGPWKEWEMKWPMDAQRFGKHGFKFKINGIVYRKWNAEFKKAYFWEKLAEKG